MKIDRLLSIVILLLKKNRVQAKELADLYEVSIRTIYRDIEAISMAGIPVVTYQGANGGIGLMEGYRLDRSMLTDNDVKDIVMGLQSLSSTLDSPNVSRLLHKFESIMPESGKERFSVRTTQFIVDHSGWGNQAAQEGKLKKVKEAMSQARTVAFTYRNAEGAITERNVEPHTLVLKGQQWFVYAYCPDREQFRLFKLSRMSDPVVTETVFARRDLSYEVLPWNEGRMEASRAVQPFTLQFNRNSRHLAEDWFGVEALTEQEEGIYTVSVPFPEDAWAYGFILSLGPDVVVKEPTHLRDKIHKMALSIASNYEEVRESS
ncbi:MULTISPECIES: YafY family protein [Paenibacillus]|uniref:helix-turn-helix transcriptional regulator n=1 Tax=Paenibacillus TaxID=44249 RepID=UPI00083DCFC8|nr:MULTISPECIES: YafY family protein [Paenibacillus]MCP3744891.1 YafY family transcriptional regulator [Paenibacillus sp. A3M_27_13]ODB58779.1 transcriptional regulator [Paenibacillus polymyxa]OMF35779.1 transcriptional regulator [Paenibacillus peoriae]